MKDLTVRPTTFKEISDKWKCFQGVVKNYFRHEKAYVMCDKQGNVNWERNPVYRESELVERKNVNILK